MYLSKLLNTENRFVKSKENSILTKEVEYPLSMLVPPLLYIFDKKKKNYVQVFFVKLNAKFKKSVCSVIKVPCEYK